MSYSLSYTGAQVDAALTTTEGVFSVTDPAYGATGDGVTDDTASIQACIDAVTGSNNGGIVYFPLGTYITSSTLTVTGKYVSLMGVSPYYTMIDASLGAGVPIVQYNGTGAAIEKIQIEGICFADITDGNALALDLDYVRKSIVRNCTYRSVSGFLNAANCFDMLYTNIHNTGSTGFNAVVLLGDECNNTRFENCTFVQASGKTAYTVDVTGNIGGLHFVNCDFEDGADTSYGAIRIRPGSSDNVRGISVRGCYFESNAGVAIELDATDAKAIQGFSFKDNYVIGKTSSGTPYGMTLTDCLGFEIKNNYFGRCATDVIQINTTNVLAGEVSYNIIENGKGDLFDNTPHKSVRVLNNYDDAGNAVLSQRHSFLSASGTWNPAEIADGADASTTITVTGAALGDAVIFHSHNIDLEELSSTAYVSAADTVEILLQNNTGGAVNLGNHTIYVQVENR
jgi:hypothetical protein